MNKIYCYNCFSCHNCKYFTNRLYKYPCSICCYGDGKDTDENKFEVKEPYTFCRYCEPTILEGEIFKSELIKKVFTTNSIFTPAAQEKAKEMGVFDKMEVYNI